MGLAEECLRLVELVKPAEVDQGDELTSLTATMWGSKVCKNGVCVCARKLDGDTRIRTEVLVEFARNQHVPCAEAPSLPSWRSKQWRKSGATTARVTCSLRRRAGE